MTLSRIGRISRALVVSMAVVLGMSACGGYTVGFMWVLGTQYNQITGFKIDDYTGNLTTMVGSPYASGGTDPVSLAVRVGGNFVFVVKDGAAQVQPIQVERQIGMESVIASGLNGGETVVTEGQLRLEKGTKVDATPAKATLPADKAAPTPAVEVNP